MAKRAYQRAIVRLILSDVRKDSGSFFVVMHFVFVVRFPRSYCGAERDEEAFQKAKKSAADGFKKIGFNPPEIMNNLNVEIERAVYCRSPY